MDEFGEQTFRDQVDDGFRMTSRLFSDFTTSDDIF